jgi:DNA-binding transcriptional MerR regulator
VNSAARFISLSEAAKQLGISTKALRLYEQRGLITPARTSAGWRAYGPTEIARAADIVELRTLGLGLSEVARIFAGDTQTFDRTLTAHKEAVEDRIRQLGHTVGKISRLRADIGRGEVLTARELIRLLKPASGISVAFDLPWPWGGESFELCDIRSLNYIVGPLGSGKTQLAKRLAAVLPSAAFVGLDRLTNEAAAAWANLNADLALKSRVHKSLAAIVDDGGAESVALLALLAALESEDPPILVIDMLEQGLDAATQEALITHLRRRGLTAQPLFFLTRSSAILDFRLCGGGRNDYPMSGQSQPSEPGESLSRVVDARLWVARNAIHRETLFSSSPLSDPSLRQSSSSLMKAMEPAP